MAASGGHVDVAVLLVANEAEIGASSGSGNTPLHAASEKGHMAIVKLLVTSGADVNARNNSNSAPMNRAGKKGHFDIVDYLVAEGAVALPVEPIAEYMKEADAEKGRQKFGYCAICHAVEEGGREKKGPNLQGVLDRERAGLEKFEYSRALSRIEGMWTYEELNAFLALPREFSPGSKMEAFRGEKDITERADLIAYLREISENPPPLPE